MLSLGQWGAQEEVWDLAQTVQDRAHFLPLRVCQLGNPSQTLPSCVTSQNDPPTPERLFGARQGLCSGQELDQG